MKTLLHMATLAVVAAAALAAGGSPSEAGHHLSAHAGFGHTELEFATAASTVAEGATPSVSVTSSSYQALTIMVDYAVTGGTATAADVTLASGTLTFESGEYSQTLPLAPVNDLLVETNETVVIELSAPTSPGVLGAAVTHTLTITNDDTGSCRGKPATHAGTNGANTINGTAGADVIVAKGGNDTVNGLGGNDLVCAGGGNDTVNGGPGADTLAGEGGDDTLAGAGGGDTLDGGAGGDTLRGGGGKDTLHGQGGADMLAGDAGKGDACDGGPGVDALLPNAGCETVAGVP